MNNCFRWRKKIENLFFASRRKNRATPCRKQAVGKSDSIKRSNELKTCLQCTFVGKKPKQNDIQFPPSASAGGRPSRGRRRGHRGDGGGDGDGGNAAGRAAADGTVSPAAISSSAGTSASPAATGTAAAAATTTTSAATATACRSCTGGLRSTSHRLRFLPRLLRPGQRGAGVHW